MPSNQLNEPQLQKLANQIRLSVLEMIHHAGSGHTGGSLGMADVFTALYFSILNHDPKKPDWPDRDRAVLSNGHICPLLYATLAYAGYFDISELNTLRQLGSRLQGHPHSLDLPGVENSSGPLGQGMSQAVGMALAYKIDKKPGRIYCLTGDGELDEGQAWEAFMFAGNNKLDNLTFIIDRNNAQIEGKTEDVMPLEPLKAKLEAFNLFVIEINGHNIEEITDAFLKAKMISQKPVAIIAHTIMGKGVSFMEGDYHWHGKAPNDEEYQKAIKELKGQL